MHAVDLPGHGRSAPLHAFTLDGDRRGARRGFRRRTRPLAVLGWSLGGLVAMRWAHREPARVGRLALVATSPRFVAGDDWPHAMSRETLARFGDELHVAWKLTIQRFLALQMQGGEHGRATLAALRRRIFARGEPSPKALFDALVMIRDADLRAEVARIAQPALVVSGTRDTLALPGAGRWLADRLPNARFALIPGAAHAPFLSHPTRSRRRSTASSMPADLPPDARIPARWTRVRCAGISRAPPRPTTAPRSCSGRSDAGWPSGSTW